MCIMEKANVYTVAHIIGGFLFGNDANITKLFIAYQLGQLALGIRAYPIEGRIEEGNSIKHTVDKIGEYQLGATLSAMIDSK